MAILVGLLAGIVGSIAGLGGGAIMVPLLILAGVEPHHAVSASLFAVLGTSLGGIIHLHKEGLLDTRLAVTLATASVTGAVIGAYVAVNIPGRVIVAIVVLVLVASGIIALRGPRSAARQGSHAIPLAWAVLLVGGFVGALAGKGGGSFNMPVLIGIMGLDSRRAAATSKLMAGFNAATATLVYAMHGMLDLALAVPLVIGTYTGATIGSRLITRMKIEHHKLIVAVIYFVLAGAATVKLVG
ncbi:protein of unknown function DUF81 [Pyrolobus fumarii 1A]|uniref:Probable membrane transporter protein n=1 Tax=Pyrolobus fumarii (strain DSM 11204 / 1A) TaxID=694429 RepID=G0EF09_PYRF1|nr:protein of unknown function DUF81 [Pyrolobus fumarii 1A]